MKFLCIKDFKMQSGEIAFRKDTLYDFNRIDEEEYVCISKQKEGHYMPIADIESFFVPFTSHGCTLVANWVQGIFQIDVKKKIGNTTYVFASFDSFGRELSNFLTGVETMDGRGLFSSFSDYSGRATFKLNEQVFQVDFGPGIFPEKGTLSKEQSQELVARIQSVRATISILNTFQEIYIP